MSVLFFCCGSAVQFCKADILCKAGSIIEEKEIRVIGFFQIVFETFIKIADIDKIHFRVIFKGGRRLIFMALLTLADGFVSTGVDYMAHLGGMLAGFLLALILVGRRSVKVVPSFPEE